MKHFYLKEESGYKVADYLDRKLNLTRDQYQKLISDNCEIIEMAPFYVMKKEEVKGSFLFRLTIIFILPVLFFLLLFLPFNFILTGKWSYDTEGRARWVYRWFSKLM